MEQHITKAEMAKRAQVSERTVQRWLRGQLTYVKLGSRVRIPESAVATFLEQRRISPARVR
jgi:excisionase family DNA binding protein